MITGKEMGRKKTFVPSKFIIFISTGLAMANMLIIIKQLFFFFSSIHWNKQSHLALLIKTDWALI